MEIPHPVVRHRSNAEAVVADLAQHPGHRVQNFSELRGDVCQGRDPGVDQGLGQNGLGGSQAALVSENDAAPAQRPSVRQLGADGDVDDADVDKGRSEVILRSADAQVSDEQDGLRLRHLKIQSQERQESPKEEPKQESREAQEFK